ncbi:MAG: Hsp20/alpha crystallin family protein [Bacteroidota bacterium]
MKLINYNRPFPTDIFRFFDDNATRAREHGSYRPAVNIVETDDHFALELLAPGRDKDLFNVAFNDGVLEISYTTTKEGEATTPNYRRREFRLKDFTRRFTLDDTVINDEAIEASYVNGVLRLTLPKREEALPREPRQIAVG